ncbi:MAG: hypothetical protein EP348_06990 [Alphaproteobacteria bacterium]|nr:MAG: hypothetical protein EP348_06990 [Alphaproteobacteria bacterium]
MSVCYLYQAQTCLFTALENLFDGERAAYERLRAEVKLRPPRVSGWGDLSTNAAMLLKSGKYISFEAAAETIMDALRALPGMGEVTLAESGYINLTYAPRFWEREANRVLIEKTGFGLEGIIGKKIAPERAAEVNDLFSARIEANAEGLFSLARLAGWEVAEKAAILKEPSGFPLHSAIGKCGLEKTRFALIANPPAFMTAFSPILAIDRSYDNPVFCIPFAKGRIAALLKGKEAGDSGAEETQGALTWPEEIALARKMCDWPLAVEEALSKGDVFYLTSFLHGLSLLFFALLDRAHPVSTDYLAEPGVACARLKLLKSTETLLSGGMELLQIHNLKEYE